MADKDNHLVQERRGKWYVDDGARYVGSAWTRLRSCLRYNKTTLHVFLKQPESFEELKPPGNRAGHCPQQAIIDDR